MKTINFTRYKLAALRDSYEQAKAEGKDEFLFEGHELYVQYAKYLIEYLELQFKPDTHAVEIDKKGEHIRNVS